MARSPGQWRICSSCRESRKTANVVLGNAFQTPGIPVDTHVARLSRRMGLTVQKDPVKIERDLNELIPREQWSLFGHRMIFHGRQICHARKPLCEQCTLASLCPRVGVSDKPKQKRRTGKKKRKQKAPAASSVQAAMRRSPTRARGDRQ